MWRGMGRGAQLERGVSRARSIHVRVPDVFRGRGRGRGRHVSARSSRFLPDLFRSVMLLFSFFHFLGWGFSGETGLVGNAMLVVIGATFIVAVLPNEALLDPPVRWLFGVIVGAGIAAEVFLTGRDLENSSSPGPWPMLAFGGITTLGLMLGLLRLRSESKERE